jgi:hypothetical protein
MRNALGSSQLPIAPTSESDRLLMQAERAVRHKIRWRKTLPLNLLTFLPGLLFIGTRSKVVLALFVFTYPLALVVRAILARILSAWIGTEEALLRIEYSKLSAEADLVSAERGDSHRREHTIP